MKTAVLPHTNPGASQYEQASLAVVNHATTTGADYTSATAKGAKFLPPAQLPLPNEREVARYQTLYLEKFGVQLSEKDAYDQARRLVQYVFLTHYALPHLQAVQHEKKPGK